jgi:Baseplate J-like protein
MAKITLADLLTAVTADQAEATILAVCKTFGLPVTSWQSGGIARTIIKVMAKVYAAFTTLIVLAVGGGFLDYSAGGWLTLLAKNVYNVDRISAFFVAAKDGIQLTNAAGGQYLIEPGDLTFSATLGGVKKTFKNTSGGLLDIVGNPGAVLTLDIQAEEVGAASSAAPGTILTLETVLLGVSVTNPIAVLGQDEELDPALRERCRDSLGALSPNGPKAAYRYIAKSAKFPDGTSCGVTKVKIPTPPGDGSLVVYVAGDSGAITGNVGDLSTALGIVEDDIQNKVVPEGVGPVGVVSAANHAIAITYTVYVDQAAGLTTQAVKDLVQAALVAFFKALPINGIAGYVRVNALIGAIENASPYILYATIASPGADVVIATSEVPTLGAITATVVQVTP